MVTLVLGVNDIPYSNAPEPLKPRKDGRPSKPRKVKSGEQTTGDVAEWLENKYHIMAVFFELHKDDIARELESGLAGSLESLMQGAPPRTDLFGTGTSKIEQMFRTFIDLKEMDALGIPGVPTLASLMGVSHRFKNKRGFPGRPSFQDTGTFEANFRSWVE